MKNLAALLLAAASLAACSKNDPQPATPAAPAPAQAATINVAFDAYATASQPASTESRSLLATKPVYKVYSDRLEVTLKAFYPNGDVQDQAVFTIPLGRQKVGLAGTYTLASQPDASLGEVLVNYTRPAGTSGAINAYTSNSTRLEGSFTLSAYDASRRIISGSYAVKCLNVKYPFSFLAAGSSGDPRRDGDLRLSGTFQELPAE